MVYMPNHLLLVKLIILTTQCESYHQHYWTLKLIPRSNVAKINSMRIGTLLRGSDAAISKLEPKAIVQSEVPESTTQGNVQRASKAALWHNERRREIIRRHGDMITTLESQRSLPLTLPLLLGSNAILTVLSILSGSFNMMQLFSTAYIFGSVLSLWQLQLLHEILHGAMLGNGTSLHKKYSKPLLFLCSFPCAFGYWLYMKYGHLSHHKLFGSMSLNSVFEDRSNNLGDGDMLFVNHRMKLKGEIGPKLKLPWKKEEVIPLSIGTSIFTKWKKSNYIANSILFSFSFLFERIMLILNDVFVAVLGKNYFFPNKSKEFQRDCTRYARVGLLIRVVLCYLAARFNPNTTSLFSLKPILFLMLCETVWSLPPHPASAMFITNHGSAMSDDGSCVPTSSTYAGKWYSIFTLGTNYHTEHHDFPTMPLHLLGKVRKIVGSDFYKQKSNDNLLQIMKKAFGQPDFYACSNDVGSLRYEFNDSHR